MSPTLSSLPVELLYTIISSLLLPDQAALCRVNKTLNRLLTPVVWSDIELHHRGTHEGIDIEEAIYSLDDEDAQEYTARLRAPEAGYAHKRLVLKPSSRKYAQVAYNRLRWKRALDSRGRLSLSSSSGRATDNCNRRNFQFGREEKLVGVRKITSKERWEELAQHVHSICMSIGVDDEVVETIASFKNLRSLELIGLPLENGHAATAPDVKLYNLENLKLRGYFSAALARKLCSNAEHIKYLDIGLLATSTDDKAYEDTLLANDDDQAVVTPQRAEYYQENGAEAVALRSQLDPSESVIKNSDDSEDDETDEDEDEEQPWALHSPIWLPKTLPQRFTSLTHLHLVKPYSGDSMFLDQDSFAHIPHRYEQILNQEWVFMLEAVAGTLKELILEHRIPMEVGDTVGDGDPHPVGKGSGRSMHFGSNRGPDRGDELFCESVLRLLLEGSNRFSQLKQLSFRGIQIKGIKVDKDAETIPGTGNTLDNYDLLRLSFPDCQIELFEKAYPIHVYAGNVYQSWPEDRHEAMQDQGDGLLYNQSYFNDYKKRFGPQWRVAI